MLIVGVMSELLTPTEIEQRAKSKGLSIADVCRRAGIAVSTFQRWKAGKTAPTLTVYQRIEAVLAQASEVV